MISQSGQIQQNTKKTKVIWGTSKCQMLQIATKTKWKTIQNAKLLENHQNTNTAEIHSQKAFDRNNHQSGQKPKTLN